MPRSYEDDEPRSRRSRYDDDDDLPGRRRNRDDDDDRPRRRGKKQSQSSVLPWVLIGGGGFLALLFIIGVIVGVVQVAKKGTTQDALAYNQNMVGAIDRLDRSYLDYNQAVVNFFDRGGDAGKVLSQHESMRRVFSEVSSQMKTWSVPGSDSAKKLHEGFVRYHQVCEEQVSKLGLIVKIVEDRSVPEDEKVQKANDIMQKYQQTAIQQMANVQALQRTFAQDYNITLINLPDANPNMKFNVNPNNPVPKFNPPKKR